MYLLHVYGELIGEKRKVPMTAHSTLADLYVETQNNIRFKIAFGRENINTQ